MPTPRLSVAVTRRLPEATETQMTELFDARLNAGDQPWSRRETIAAMQAADVLVPTVTDRLDASVLREAGDRLKLIASFGNGVDHIDIQAARARGILVTNTPGILTEDTADMAMALILAVFRRLGEGERLVRSGKWQGWAPLTMLGRRLAGKQLGIVGMGRIGASLARRARSFGLTIHYHNRKRVAPALEAALDATYWESLDQMLARMDIISINCPHTPATYHILSARRLRLMPSHAILINTARGEIVDETVLTQRLVSGELAGAGLDVFEHEPNVPKKLLELENLVLLPHIASATWEARVAMGEKVIHNITAFAEGRSPPDCVLD